MMARDPEIRFFSAETAMAHDPAPLDPAEFRQPRTRQPTRHLYLANCGQRCGETPQTIIDTFNSVLPGVQVEGLHVGTSGVSYVSFATPEAAEQMRVLVSGRTRWIVRFAEREGTNQGPVIPSSVASTVHIVVPGLELVPDFVDEAEGWELLAAIDAQPWDTTIKRRVQHYGHAFDYARLAIAEGTQTPEFPGFCAIILERLCNLKALPHQVNQLTVNEYQPGVGIAFHTDAHSAFEDGIAALTLGAGIVMEFRRPEPAGGSKVSVGKHHRLAPPPCQSVQAVQKNVWLPANSLLILRGEARYAWQHGIAWRKTDCIVEGEAVARSRRVSLTFRSARHYPCDCHWPMMCDAQNPVAHVLPSRLGAAPQQESLLQEE